MIKPSIKQVEFNSISTSSGGLAQRVTKLHKSCLYSVVITKFNRHLQYLGFHDSSLAADENTTPDNLPAEKLAWALGEPCCRYVFSNRPSPSDALAILSLVQNSERNVFDQRWLEYHVIEGRRIPAVRMTLPEIATSAALDDKRMSLVPTLTGGGGWHRVAVVYLRAGYGPSDYTPQKWDARRCEN